MTYILEPLPFAYNALEPYFDEATMKVHHNKHHQAYTDKFNATLKDYPQIAAEPAQEVLRKLHTLPEKIRQAVANHGGGYVNHNFFWSILKKDVAFQGEIADAISKTFGSRENFEKEFKKAALSQFGSGWAWLILNSKGELRITKTLNQATPLSDGHIPLLALDVWEHAYYLKYQNKRADFVDAFFNVINWDYVSHLYDEAQKHLECR
ncbi:MAG: superoxide dismutase [Candidatus Nanoarchaeia archaeon]